jgi:hypothetical protein
MANLLRALRVSLNHRPPGRSCQMWKWYIEF